MEVAVCLEILVLLLDTRWIPGAVCSSDVTPTTAFNVTLSNSVNSTSSGGVVGRAAVALGVAGVIGVAMYILRKKGSQRGSHLSRRPQGPRRGAAFSRGGALLTDDQSASSVPLLQSNEDSDLDPGEATPT